MPRFMISNKVIVGILVYNDESFVKQTLDSLRNQTYADFSVLISDNASTDKTGEICREICQKDQRFSYVRHKKNLGSHRSGWFLFDHCDSQYITFLGGHDHVAPTYLQKHVENLDKHPKASISFSHINWKDVKGNIIQTTNGGDINFPEEVSPAKRVMMLLKAICECTAINQLIRREFMLDYPVKRIIGGHDRILLTHLIAHGPFVRIEEPLYYSLVPQRADNGVYDMDAHMERISGINKSEMQEIERLTGIKNSEIREADHIIEHIRCIWHHKNIRQEDKPSVIWFLLNVFEMYRKWSQPSVRTPFAYEEPAEMIISESIAQKLPVENTSRKTDPVLQNEMYRDIQNMMSDITPEEAISKLENLANAFPHFALAYNDLGVLHYNTGDKEKALHYYRKAVQLAPENITFQKNLADFLYVESGRVEEALQIYVNILAAHPDDVETLLVTGHICIALEKFDDAGNFYNRVLEIEPENENVRQNLKALKNYLQKDKAGSLDSSPLV